MSDEQPDYAEHAARERLQDPARETDRCPHCEQYVPIVTHDCPAPRGLDADIAALNLRSLFEAEGRTQWSEADPDGTVTVHYTDPD